MNEYKGFNFGPELGPIKNGSSNEPFARWVHVYREASPLEPGVNEWLWYDNPDGGFGGGALIRIPVVGRVVVAVVERGAAESMEGIRPIRSLLIPIRRLILRQANQPVMTRP